MKTRNSVNVYALSTLGIAMLVSPLAYSEPLDDRVTVTMPYTTTIGHKTLPPGDYLIKRMSSLGGSRVLLVYSDDGMKFETSAMTIPVLDPNVARDTRIVLSKVGDDYYYDKVWVEGKSYGYQFLLPKEARDRQRELLAVAARPATEGPLTAAAETAQAPHALPVEPEPVAENVPAETPSEANPAEVAKAEPLPISEPEPLPAPPADAAASPEEQPPSATPQREEMPSTSAGWMGLLLSGGSLFGLGLKLRRKA